MMIFDTDLLTQALAMDFDAHGHMRDPHLWTPDHALKMATFLGMTLEEAHWSYIKAARTLYDRYEIVPGQRPLLQLLAQDDATKDLASSLRFAILFEEPSLRRLCWLAGLPKPRHCL